MLNGKYITDAEYRLTEMEIINGKKVRTWICPVYQDWRNMVYRVESNKLSTYNDVIVCDEWKYFLNFRRWVLEEQPNKNWENCHLDKDLLGCSGNKIYSPATCVYISSDLNLFLSNRKAMRGKYMLGVSWKNHANAFQARCNIHSVGDKEHLGYFATELEAHKAWQAKKHEYACRWADIQDDPRVAQALRERYAPDKDWTYA